MRHGEKAKWTALLNIIFLLFLHIACSKSMSLELFLSTIFVVFFSSRLQTSALNNTQNPENTFTQHRCSLIHKTRACALFASTKKKKFTIKLTESNWYLLQLLMMTNGWCPYFVLNFILLRWRPISVD